MVLSRIILGLLAIAPMTGYDVKRHFDSTAAHFWSADKAQVYRALARLVDDGLAEVRTVPGRGGPDRQEHHLTDAGRDALRAWLAGPVEPHADRDPFLARVFLGGDLDDEQLRDLLAARRAAALERLALFESMRDGVPTDRAARLRFATLENGIAHVRAELDWLDDTEGRLL